MASDNNTTARYVVEPHLSRFTVKASVSGLLKVFGHDPTISIRGFEGEIRLDPDDLESSSLQFRIDPGALDVPQEMNSKDRREMEKIMKDEVLETSRFPEIVFESGKVAGEQSGEGNYRFNINGELTMHGQTHAERISAQVSVNGQNLHAHGEFTLLQTDYGIKPYSAAGGVLKLKDELKLSFDLVARKAQEADA